MPCLVRRQVLADNLQVFSSDESDKVAIVKTYLATHGLEITLQVQGALAESLRQILLREVP